MIKFFGMQHDPGYNFPNINTRLLLERAGKRLRNRQLWRDSGLLMFANLIVTLLGLVRTPAMTWLLPKTEIGMLGVVASWLPFVQLLSLPGLDSASYHYVAKGLPGAFLVNLAHRLRWSLLSAACFLMGAGYWAWQGQSELAWLFAVTGVAFPVTVGLTACAGMLGAQENYRGLFWYRLGESLADFAGFLPLAFAAWWVSRIFTFYTANLAATAVMQIGVSYFLALRLRQNSTPRLAHDEHQELLRYGKHQTLIGGIGTLQNRTDSFLVGLLMPLAVVADYSIAILISEQLKRLWSIYVTVRYPPLVKMPVKQRRRRFVIEGILILLGFAGTGLVISLLGHWLIPVLLPAAYSSSLGYMDLLIATVLVGIPGGMAELFFRTEQDARTQYLMRIAASAVGVIAPAILVFSWGAYGAAAGRLLSNLILGVLGVWFFYQKGISSHE